jgi:hypothetical protein
MYVGMFLFAGLAVLVVVVFVISIRRRRAYERGEWEPGD